VGGLPPISLQEIEFGRGQSLALVLRFSPLLQRSSVPARREATRNALRSVLGKLTSRLPLSLCFGRTSQGKPYLEGDDLVAFNISHSKNWSLIALSRSQRIGCDIEDRFSDDDVGQLGPLVLHASELEAMAQLAEQHRRDAFMRNWVRKEAVLKAEGSGFLADPKTVVVGLEGGQAAKWMDRAPLNLHNRPIAAGCAAAVASEDAACAWYRLTGPSLA
jgi:phosphopantetheinyl transferase